MRDFTNIYWWDKKNKIFFLVVLIENIFMKYHLNRNLTKLLYFLEERKRNQISFFDKVRPRQKTGGQTTSLKAWLGHRWDPVIIYVIQWHCEVTWIKGCIDTFFQLSSISAPWLTVWLTDIDLVNCLDFNWFLISFSKVLNKLY